MSKIERKSVRNLVQLIKCLDVQSMHLHTMKNIEDILKIP